MRLRTIFSIAALVLTVCWAASPLSAQVRPAHSSRSAIVLPPIPVKGIVYKPQAFNLITRKNLNLDWDLRDPRFKKSFIDKLTGAVRTGPF